MNRGPQPGRSRADHTATALENWSPAPDWVLVLAAAASASTGKAVGLSIGYSPAVVSDVLRNKYRGDLGRVEQAVRGALMGATVACPELGDLPRDRCLGWQSKPFSSASPLTVRMHGACRRCPNALAARNNTSGGSR